MCIAITTDLDDMISFQHFKGHNSLIIVDKIFNDKVVTSMSTILSYGWTPLVKASDGSYASQKSSLNFIKISCDLLTER